MGMELLTSTDTNRLHERASALLVNMEALRDELLRLDGAVRGLYPGWEGEAADAMYPLWRDWYTAMRESSYITTEAGYTMSRLANELELAQVEYRQQLAAAEAAGFSVRADGMLAQPAATATADPAALAQQADEFRLYVYRIEGALAEAEAADQRAADKFIDSNENPALAQFLKTYGEKAEPLYSALGGGLLATASGLEQFARRPGVSAAERAKALATARRYRALVNNPALRTSTRTVRGMQVLGLANIPLNYVQNVASGDDRGLAATKATVGGGISLGTGAATGAAVTSFLGATGFAAAFPPVAVGLATTAGVIAAITSMSFGNQVATEFHHRFVTPYLGPVITPLSEDIQEFGDNLRTEFWRDLGDLRDHATNFPEDFREAIMG